MSFELEGRVIKVRGDPTLTRAELSLKMMTHTWEVDDQGFWIEFSSINLNWVNFDSEGSLEMEEQWNWITEFLERGQ